MMCMPVDDMYMTPGVVLHEIGQLRQVQMTSADEGRMTYGCHPHMVWMMCG